MSFIYKNPLTSSQLDASSSVARDKVFGSNFSVLQIGGYMEVYTLADLDFTIPEGETGLIEFTGNTIPINYSKRVLPFLPDTVNLNSDNISTGRRRLGMLVYVHETNLTYQYTITNYESLWDGAGESITESDYGTTVTTSTPGGAALIDAWLDSSIEGVSGVTRSNARWRIFYGTDITVTGGTYDNNTGTATFTNTTGGTFNVTGFTSGIVDTNIANTDLTLDGSRVLNLDGNDLDIIGGTGERLSLTSTDLVLSGSSGGGTVTIKGISSSTENRALVINTNGVISYNDSLSGEVAISALTYNSEWGVTKDLTDSTSGTTLLPFITGGTFSGPDIILKMAGGLETDITISGPESADVYVISGDYDNSTGSLTLTRNDAGTVVVTGFTTGTTEDTYVTGVSYNQLSKTLTLGLNDGVDFSATGFAPTITGGTYSNGEITLGNNDGTSTLITGLEILTHIGTSTTSTVSVSGTIIDTVDATTYKGAFFDYVIDDGTNYRAGTIQSVWDRTTIRYNDFSTVDIGNTTNFVWGMELTDENALLKADISGGTWDIRIIKHII